MGSPWGHRKLSAHLAKSCNCVALSIDYRLTPEHPYPAPLDDCVAAYKWLLDQGYSASKIVTAGDSCGGGLATAVPLAAARRGLPQPGAAVALSPWYDATGSGASMVENADKDELGSAESIRELARMYTADGASPEDPLISPLFADPTGLPPHWISCGGYDTLRDQGIAFAEKARAAGVDVLPVWWWWLLLPYGLRLLLVLLLGLLWLLLLLRDEAEAAAAVRQSFSKVRARRSNSSPGRETHDRKRLCDVTTQLEASS